MSYNIFLFKKIIDIIFILVALSGAFGLSEIACVFSVSTNDIIKIVLFEDSVPYIRGDKRKDIKEAGIVQLGKIFVAMMVIFITFIIAREA